MTTVRVFSRPNGVPATADLQGSPRKTHFEQSLGVTGLYIQIYKNARWSRRMTNLTVEESFRPELSDFRCAVTLFAHEHECGPRAKDV